MGYSKVTLYEVGFDSSQNCIVDNLTTLLSTASSLEISDNMFIKHALDINLKVQLPQYTSSHNYNYVQAVNYNDLGVADFTYYYYIRKYNWTSESACMLSLSLDTLNTFKNDILGHFTAKTYVMREHKDRFIQDDPFETSFRRKIDVVSEFEGLTKYNTSKSVIDGEKWYLIYVTASSESETLDCYLLPTNDNHTVTTSSGLVPGELEHYHNRVMILEACTLEYTTGGGTTAQVSFNGNKNDYAMIWDDYSNLQSGKLQLYRLSSTDGAPFTVNETLIADNIVEIHPVTPTSMNCYAIKRDVWELRHLIIAGVSTETNQYDFIKDMAPKIDYTFSSTPVVKTISTFSQVNTSLSAITKIIECPYCPISLTDKKVGGTSVLTDDADDYLTAYVINPNEELGVTIKSASSIGNFSVELPDHLARRSIYKNLNYESKLYHSDLFNLTYMYDSFSKTLPLQNIEAKSSGSSPTLEIKYKQSNAMSSNLLFDFKVDNVNSWKKQDLYENILICKRNNEKPVYNNNYLNYIRTGYNYDVKAKEEAYKNQVMQSSVTGIGAVASFLVGILGAGATGGASLGAGIVSGISLLTSTIHSATSIHYNDVMAKDSMQKRLDELKTSTVSVTANDDLDLMNYYNGNKLYQTIFRVSDEVRNKALEMFFLTGYKTDTYKIPNLTTRYRFNYLQADIDLNTKYKGYLQPYYDDIVERFKLGVTVFHTNDDFNQIYENWESWLIV